MDLLLPIPSPQDVDGFVELYEREFGKRLSKQEAIDMLGGLMRWVYLTEVKKSSAEDGTTNQPSHDR